MSRLDTKCQPACHSRKDEYRERHTSSFEVLVNLLMFAVTSPDGGGMTVSFSSG